MATAILRPSRETKVRMGHPWLYASEIDRLDGEAAPGSVVDVKSAKGTFLGRAFYNSNSQITLRMLTTRDEVIDRDFFVRRVRDAWAYRQIACDTDSCRVIYSESDGLPGLIVDKFGPVLSLQALSYGIENVKDIIVEALNEVVRPQGIYERSDVPVRRLEGLEEKTGLLSGEVPDIVEMRENGLTFLVDVKRGQKTGYFLDQKENRAAMAPFAQGATVLDCFCHNGSFALHAAKYGAKDVLGVDISEDALTVARKNAEVNGLHNVRFEAQNCFDLLRQYADEKRLFDLVILDPPAFTKNRAGVERALRGYKEINLRGLKLTRPGGFLITCSCSQHVSQQMFEDMLKEAIRDAKKRVRLVESRTQGKDHPILPASPETKYLKCMILQVVE